MTTTEQFQELARAAGIPVATLARISGMDAQRIHNILSTNHRAIAQPVEVDTLRIALDQLRDRITQALEPNMKPPEIPM